MAPQDILRQLKQDLFKPFRLHISDGTAFDVLDPFMARVELTQLWLGVEFDDDTGLPKKLVYLAPNHVTRLEPLLADDAAVPNGTNGRS